MFLIENVEGIGLTITAVRIAVVEKSNIGKVKDGKCIGYTEKQCIDSYVDHLKSKNDELKAYLKTIEDENQINICKGNIRKNNNLMIKLRDIERSLNEN